MEPISTASPSVGRALIAQAFSDAVVGIDETDRSRAKLLDAARDLFSRYGIQRTSMEEVAKRAGLSRITIYRKFDTKDALVEQVLIREFRTYFSQFLEDVRGADSVAERLVIGFVSSLRSIGRDSIIGRLLDAEPEMVVGSIIGDGSEVFDIVREFVAGQLRREQAAGTIADTLDAELVAEMLVRVSASFLTVPSQIVDLDDDEQLAAIARQFLVPMIE